jgi:hypothetical protein
MTGEASDFGRIESWLLRRAARHEAVSRRVFSLLYFAAAVVSVCAAWRRFRSDPEAVVLLVGSALLLAGKAGADLEGSFWEGIVARFKERGSALSGGQSAAPVHHPNERV